MAQAAVKEGARGLTPTGERDLIQRVVEAAGEGATREVDRIASRIGWRNMLKLAAWGFALLCGGYLTGYWNAAAARIDTAEGASFMRT